jgi:predicted alternative tryptophan synthase beta-subunit
MVKTNARKPLLPGRMPNRVDKKNIDIEVLARILAEIIIRLDDIKQKLEKIDREIFKRLR